MRLDLPDFNVEDIFVVLNGGTALVIFVVGFVVGVLFLASDRRRSGPLLVMGLTMGVTFTGTMLGIRYLQDSPRWETWLAELVLVGIYGTGMILGAIIRKLIARR